MNEEDYSPIIACSSGLNSNVAISLIRLSGFKDLLFLKPFIDKDIKTLKPRFAHFLKLKDKSEIIDEVVLTFFKAPNSYNGENIIELSVHGNTLNVERIINLFIDAGFRYAKAGEFTFRAFKNKKLSLSQIEGLDLFLNATSPLSLKQGFSLLSGDLQISYKELYERFLDHKSAIELGIDFLDDVGDVGFNKVFTRTLDALEEILETFKARINVNNINLISPDIALIGKPNSGKSSLFNTLLKFDRSIISSEKGTTRDYVKEKIFFNGIIFNLIDTAGIRETENKIEKEGIKKAITIAESSFFKVFLVNPFDFTLSDLEDYKRFDFDLILFTHADFYGFNEAVKVAQSYFGGSIEPQGAPIGPTRTAPIEPGAAPMGPKSGSIEPKIPILFIKSMALSDSELAYFKNLIELKFKKLTSNQPILLERQRFALKETINAFDFYKNLLLAESDISILSSELNIVGHCISELIGIVSPDDVLHNIFSNFCIGK